MATRGESLRESDASVIDLAIDDQERIFPDVEPGESGAIAAYEVGRISVRGHVYFPAWDGSEPDCGEVATVTVTSLGDIYEGLSNKIGKQDLLVIADAIGADVIDEELFVDSDDIDAFLRRMIANSLMFLHDRLEGII